MKTLLEFLFLTFPFILAQNVSDSVELFRKLARSDDSDDSFVLSMYPLFATNFPDIQDEFVEKFGPDATMASRIYLSESLNQSLARDKYYYSEFHVPVEKVNFNSPETLNKINSWVEENTKGKVKNTLPSDSINEKTEAILAVGLYFKGTWKYQFKKADTVDEDFYISATEKVSVKTMQLTAYLNYFEHTELDAKFLELPYESNLRMWIWLPNKVDGLFNFNIFNDSEIEFKIAKVHVRLPKFSVEMGNKSISHYPNISPKTIEIYDKFVFEVDEEGAQAASDTIEVKSRSEPVNFIANHPFIFGVVNDNSILFYGGVARP